MMHAGRVVSDSSLGGYEAAQKGPENTEKLHVGFTMFRWKSEEMRQFYSNRFSASNDVRQDADSAKILSECRVLKKLKLSCWK